MTLNLLRISDPRLPFLLSFPRASPAEEESGKAITGLSATAFIRDCKLKKAKELLKEDMPISEVAYASGFNDHAYFSRCFKKTYGFNPSDISKTPLNIPPADGIEFSRN